MSIKGTLAFFLPYFIGVGACYQLGYWGELDINVLQFIGIPDLAKLALQPLLIGVAASVILSVVADLTISRILPPGAGSQTPTGLALKRFGRWILAFGLLLGVVLGVFLPSPSKWYVVSTIFGLCSVALCQIPQLAALLPEPRIRQVVLYLLVTTPLWGFADGSDAAHRTTVRRIAETVDVTRSKLPLVANPKQPVLYLGLLGETYILRETSSGQTIYVKRGESPLFINARAKY